MTGEKLLKPAALTPDSSVGFVPPGKSRRMVSGAGKSRR
jgi:hypothetical protein